MGKGLQHSSGRVIGVGRLLLGTLFLLAILLDRPRPEHATLATYAILAAYVAFAAVTVLMTWRDWWLDARVAGPAHAIDIGFFTVLVVVTQGYSSPYFAFFMFVLLSAAIRWGWRATALTAILLVILYVIAGWFTASPTRAIEFQDFALRTGHLVILSLILIWFGATRWRVHRTSQDRGASERPSLDEPPIETNLEAAIAATGSASGAFAWRERERHDLAATTIRAGELERSTVSGQSLEKVLAATPFVYEIFDDRGLRKDADRNIVRFSVRDAIPAKVASDLKLNEGLAIPIHAGEADGMMFLEGIRGLSTDHIDLGEKLAEEIAANMQAHALLRATEERAEARSRLTLARDLHDGVVQFMAGATFRLEAMLRSNAAGRDVAGDLDELKQLMLQEQRDLRTFITALRSGPLVPMDDLARDMKALAARLARQWNVRCDFSVRTGDLMIPARLHLDVQQLTREAVANAVRHADAKTITISLRAESGELRLKVLNDGLVSRSPDGRLRTPMSLKERVEDAGGSLDISRGMDVTKLSIALPISARHP